MRTICLLACAEQKLACSAPASELYTSRAFRASLGYARALRSDAVYILSAKHGLLSLDTVVEPYDVKLDETSVTVWTARVIGQLTEVADLARDKFVFLASGHYVNTGLLKQLCHWEVPFAGANTGWPTIVQQESAAKRVDWVPIDFGEDA